MAVPKKKKSKSKRTQRHAVWKGKAALAADLPTIFVPSYIPIVLDENIKLDCVLDSLGDENNVANVIKGPKLKKSYVDYSFLCDYLVSFSNAKN